MSSPEKKRNTTESIPNISLPDDLLLSCIARVSRLYYPTLSLVSKSFRSLLASPELHNTRSLLGHTERCLYVVLRFTHDPNPRWFTLCHVPDVTSKKKKKSSDNLLVPIPCLNSAHAHSSSNLVAFGSNIYKFGGDVVPSSRVSVLDCKSHTWHQTTSMRVDRSSSSSTVRLLNGKIYVVGGCDPSSVNWVEAFDPKTQTWSSVQSPSTEICNGGVVKSLGLEGKFYLFEDKMDKCEVYNPKESRWNPVRYHRYLDFVAKYSRCCVIDNVLFFLSHGRVYWLDSKINICRELKGVEDLPHFPHHERCRMVDYGGKLVFFWEECDDYQENMIWCAEIALKRPNRYEIRGKVEWFDVVLSVPKSCSLLDADALSVVL